MNQFLAELNNSNIPNPEGNVFRSIWGQYEKVVLQSLLTTFGLDFIVHDQRGGDVDTVHTVKESDSFKNPIYAERARQIGKYNETKYHTDKSYRETIKSAKETFNRTGEPIRDAYNPDNNLYFNKSTAVDSEHRANLDHVIAANEIHNDKLRILANKDGVSLANDSENLRFTNEKLNKQKGDLSIEEFIKKRENDGNPLTEKEIEQLRAEDKRARQHYEEIINEAYYTSPQFYADMASAAAKRGLEMGARQALGFLLLEVWFACKEELKAIEPGNGFQECFTAIRSGILKGIDNAGKKYKELIREFINGLTAGALASLTTTLCNVFFSTEKNLVRFIRYSYASIVQAGTIILINPEELPLGDQLKRATIILATGASSIIGSLVGDMINKTPIAAIPLLGESLTTFVSVLTSGLLSCTFLIMLDQSQLINQMIQRMNQYATEDYNLAQQARFFSDLAAKIEGYDLDTFSEECSRFSTISYAVSIATDEELDVILNSIYEHEGFNTPWKGDFDDFMDDNTQSLIFD